MYFGKKTFRPTSVNMGELIYIDYEKINTLLGKKNLTGINIEPTARKLDAFLSDLNNFGAKLYESGSVVASFREEFKGSIDYFCNGVSSGQTPVGVWDVRIVGANGEKIYAKRKMKQEAKTGIKFIFEANDLEGSPWTLELPFYSILKAQSALIGTHSGYCHRIMLSDSSGDPLQVWRYNGITKRNWLQRMSEHFYGIRSNSRTLFHSKWRYFLGDGNATFSSELVGNLYEYEELLQWEEDVVDEDMESDISLNMIFGGRKGMRFLHEHANKYLDSDNATITKRDKAVRKFLEDHPQSCRKGVPNLIVSDLWKDDEYALKVICGGEKRLSVEQVQHIWDLHFRGVNIDKISDIVKARNIPQVQRVIDEVTYTRVPQPTKSLSI